MKIVGTYCVFDYSKYPQYRERAMELVEYFDQKYPQILNLVGLPFSRTPTNITMKPIRGAGKPQGKDYDIDFDPDYIDVEDKGFLIHEGTHIAQNFSKYIEWVIEAMAECVRLELGWDNPKCTYNFKYEMIQRYVGLEGQSYWVWANFFTWLKNQYQGNNFLIDFTSALKIGDSDNDFLQIAFGKTSSQLWQDYCNEHVNKR